MGGNLGSSVAAFIEMIFRESIMEEEDGNGLPMHPLS
jgi:hypothetical protein